MFPVHWRKQVGGKETDKERQGWRTCTNKQKFVVLQSGLFPTVTVNLYNPGPPLRDHYITQSNCHGLSSRKALEAERIKLEPISKTQPCDREVICP